ncbi:ABC transporter permease [Pseudoroseicyclus aestuarii]|uniref:Peptide/nickel transport system permease protein n=1 Tax=Pseudoroseicyclus aestuarii TaxID=1795041 RepID=A0A318SM17_9RHOB|nr:ABC transporter permease [Pseudoroseicyclus aestuarii]PYE80592.1 peptide/nickel transport system permease protein [Pseudoroseicyclus aestuarii]
MTAVPSTSARRTRAGFSILRRGGASIGVVVTTLLGLLVLTFVVGRMVPADPVIAIIGDQADQAAYDRVYSDLGLDQPLWRQFASYVGDVVTLDFGESNLTRNAVSTDLARVFPATVELASAALIIGTLLGVPLGVAAAVRRDSWVDHLARVVGLVGYSTPIFWLGMMVLLVFYAKLGWVPSGGRVGIYYEGLIEGPTGFLTLDAILARDWETARSALYHLMTPALILGYANTAYISRMSRSFMLEQLQQEYILTAQAKGASRQSVVWRHAFGNMRVQLLTVIALAYCGLLDGTVLIETVFGWPGLGQYLTTALFFADMNAVLGAVLLIGLISIAINLLCDIAYRMLDPRTK